MIMPIKAAFRGATICALFALGLTASMPASATTLLQSWNGYKWSRTGPLAIKAVTNVRGAWKPYVKTAASQWSSDKNIDYVLTAGNMAKASVCGPSYGTLQLCSGDYGKTGWLGYTQVWTAGSKIVMATIKLNDYYFSQPKYNTAAFRAAVVCQEMGNALGLQDSDRNYGNVNLGTCTDYTNDPTGQKGSNGTLANIAPSATDIRNLDAIYATLDRTQITSTKPTGVSGNAYLAAAVPEPGAWSLMLAGFGVVGAALRRRPRAARADALLAPSRI